MPAENWLGKVVELIRVQPGLTIYEMRKNLGRKNLGVFINDLLPMNEIFRVRFRDEAHYRYYPVGPGGMKKVEALTTFKVILFQKNAQHGPALVEWFKENAWFDVFGPELVTEDGSLTKKGDCLVLVTIKPHNRSLLFEKLGDFPEVKGGIAWMIGLISFNIILPQEQTHRGRELAKFLDSDRELFDVTDDRYVAKDDLGEEGEYTISVSIAPENESDLDAALNEFAKEVLGQQEG